MKTNPAQGRKTRVVLPLETLVDAWALSQVEGLAKAAQFYGVHPTTISRAGEKIARDDELSAIAARKREELATEWRPKAMRALSAGLDALEGLFTKAKPEQLRDVAGAVHLLAEKIIAVDAINPHGRRLPSSRQGATLPAAGGALGGGPARAGSGSDPIAPAATPGAGSEPIRH